MKSDHDMTHKDHHNEDVKCKWKFNHCGINSSLSSTHLFSAASRLQSSSTAKVHKLLKYCFNSHDSFQKP